jgi:hypothetical protein
MFGFGFDNGDSIYQTRGDQRRRRSDFSDYLLDVKIDSLRHFLAGQRAGRVSADAG